MPGLAFFMTGYTDDDYWAKKVPDSATTADFPRQLKRFLEESYPGLFTDTADGTRVDIRFTISKFKETSTASSFLAEVSWGVFGIILPLPIAMQYDCAMQLSFPDMALEQSAEFHNRMDTWISFPSPLALIPVPASAQRRAIGVHPFQSKYYSGRLFTLECFSQAVVQALEKNAGRLSLAKNNMQLR
jgi:hypothetical protein